MTDSDAFVSRGFEELRFDDGGSYCGGTEGGKAHGHGTCTGPDGQGEYAGTWNTGFEESGVYVFPSGNDYAGQWNQGKRHGLGMERKGHWVYSGDWNHGLCGRYGVRESVVSASKYEGTWTSGVADGYGIEVYSDAGSYEGQWIKGVRHGYGVRKTVPYGRAAMCRLPNTRKTSLTSVRSEVESSEHPPPDLNDPLADEGPVSHPSARLGFFLKEKGDETTANQNSSANRNQSPLTAAFEAATRESANRQGADGSSGGKTDGDAEVNTDGSPKTSKVEVVPDTAVETYSGEWRNDKRSGFGVATRSDGLRYEGEWSNNCKNGFGMTTFSDGTKEEGCYKNNVLQAPGKRLALLRAAKLREQVESAVASAQRTSQIALQKAGIATSRADSARSKATEAIKVAEKARLDAEKAKCQFLAHLEQQREKQRAAGLSNAVNEGGRMVARQSFKVSQTSLSRTLNRHTQSLPKINIDQPDSGQASSLNTAAQAEYSGVTNGMSPVLSGSRSALAALEGIGNDLVGENGSKPQNKEPTEVAEIENIFSYLAEEESSDPTSPAVSPTDAPPEPPVEPQKPKPFQFRNLVLFKRSMDLRDKTRLTGKARRVTLPSIMKYTNTPGPVEGRGQGKYFSSPGLAAITEGLAQMHNFVQNTETVVIDHGLRTRLEEEKDYRPPPLPPDIDPVEELVEPPKDLRRRFKMEPMWHSRRRDLGSVPDVSIFKRWEAEIIPRQEANLISKQTREELEQRVELERQSRRRAIVIKFGNFKDWCKRHCVAIFIVLVNFLVAYMFLDLLY